MSKKKIFDHAYRYDIALDEGMGPWMVAWISGLMVFFVTLALAVNFLLSAATQHWVEGLENSVTVELQAPPAGDAARHKEALAAAQKVVDLGGKHPAVASARLMTRDEVRKLVEPWLGRRLPDDLPLPLLVDIRLAPGADPVRLENDIGNLVPGAVLDTHGGILDGVKTLADTARMFVLLLTGIITSLAAVSIAGIVRAKFSIHGREVETLHLIGAADEYIARQFRLHTLKGAMKGALGGLVCMVLTLLVVGWATHTVDAALLPRLTLMPLQWVAVIFSPVLIGSLIAHLAAHRAVMRELARLP